MRRKQPIGYPHAICGVVSFKTNEAAEIDFLGIIWSWGQKRGTKKIPFDNFTGKLDRAMPHIKTYTRYNGQRLAWFLLTSSNLSKAAWGALQKNNSQLMIRSYELGVLFLPSSTRDRTSEFSCTGNGGLKLGEYKLPRTEGCQTKLVTLGWKGQTDPSTEVIQLPVPYQLPPQPYTSEDVPWSWDRRYTKKDVYGQVWPRH